MVYNGALNICKNSKAGENTGAVRRLGVVRDIVDSQIVNLSRKN